MKNDSIINCSDSILLEKYLIEANEKRINPNLVDIPQASVDDFLVHNESMFRFKAYMNRLIGIMQESISTAPFVIALFDCDGYFIKATGNKEVIDDIEKCHIGKGSIWNLDQLGPNAVTIGLIERKNMSSKGNMNYNFLLKKYAIYYSPIVLKSSRESYDVEHYGGFALIVPIALDNLEYQRTLFLFTNNITVFFLQSRIVYEMGESVGYSMMIININKYNGKAFTFYNSENIFELLEVPPKKISVKPTGEFIDPLPNNKEFWSIVDTQKEVIDYKLTISINGEIRRCIVTTKSMTHVDQGMHSICFFFTTAQKTASNISKKIGYTAQDIAFENIIGESTIIKSIIRKAHMISKMNGNTMLLGESGVGKELFARAIHNASNRRKGPFVAINCGSLPRELIASELFGYEGGAFTGAKRHGNIGKFELANGGTIFLDEIGEMPLDLQSTLLRIVEQKKFMRIGGNHEVSIDVRIISATNVDIQEMISTKRFRMDLYYRLSSVNLNIPPLRERETDVILLAEHFIRSISNRIGRKDIMVLSDEAKHLLSGLSWPGNVRELQNLIECIVQLYDDAIITPVHIQENLLFYKPRVNYMDYSSFVKQDNHQKKQLLTENEIKEALEASGGNRSQAARLLGINRRALYRNMERLGIYIKK